MKCPLFTIGRTDVQLGVESDYGECLMEMCAWWDGHGGFCAVLKIARHFEGINLSYKEVLKRESEGGEL